MDISDFRHISANRAGGAEVRVFSAPGCGMDDLASCVVRKATPPMQLSIIVTTHRRSRPGGIVQGFGKRVVGRKKALPRCPNLAYTYWHDGEADAAQRSALSQTSSSFYLLDLSGDADFCFGQWGLLGIVAFINVEFALRSARRGI